MRRITVALAGNPNCGKSTIFNALTGSHQHVGNWPGKTVALKQGYYDADGIRVEVVDLPGAYSLSPYSPEEKIARDYIVQHQPDIVVNVLDAANLERNLYLTTQILETGARPILVLNMWDELTKRGYDLDCQELSRRLGGIAVIPTVASRGTGLAELRQAITTIGPNTDNDESKGETAEYGASRPEFGPSRALRGCH